jgi:hypothetical protein
MFMLDWFSKSRTEQSPKKDSISRLIEEGAALASQKNATLTYGLIRVNQPRQFSGLEFPLKCYLKSNNGRVCEDRVVFYGSNYLVLIYDNKATADSLLDNFKKELEKEMPEGDAIDAKVNTIERSCLKSARLGEVIIALQNENTSRRFYVKGAKPIEHYNSCDLSHQTLRVA